MRPAPIFLQGMILCALGAFGFAPLGAGAHHISTPREAEASGVDRGVVAPRAPVIYAPEPVDYDSRVKAQRRHKPLAPREPKIHKPRAVSFDADSEEDLDRNVKPVAPKDPVIHEPKSVAFDSPVELDTGLSPLAPRPAVIFAPVPVIFPAPIFFFEAGLPWVDFFYW